MLSEEMKIYVVTRMNNGTGEEDFVGWTSEKKKAEVCLKQMRGNYPSNTFGISGIDPLPKRRSNKTESNEILKNFITRLLQSNDGRRYTEKEILGEATDASGPRWSIKTVENVLVDLVRQSIIKCEVTAISDSQGRPNRKYKTFWFESDRAVHGEYGCCIHTDCKSDRCCSHGVLKGFFQTGYSKKGT